MVDAVVIGSGPNGLVAGNLLAGAGWEVTVLEARSTPGGGVSSASYLGEGWTTDVCSAFYPLVAASPVFRGLQLERFGLRWSHAPAVIAHAFGDQAVLLRRDPEETAAGLDAIAPGDGEAWMRLYRLWRGCGSTLLDALLAPFPPLRAATKLAGELRPGGLLRFARFAMLPVRRVAEEEFAGPGAGLLLAGCALHADFAPESAASAFFGWLLCMLGHDVGYPVPVGGAGQLTSALVRRLESYGGSVLCDRPVVSVEIRDGRAVAAITADGERFPACHAVLADVDAPQLYGRLIGRENLPAGLADDLRRFHWDWSTVKFDWALRARVPWTAKEVSQAGTVHVADSLDSLTRFSADMACGQVSARPFLLLGQLSTADPTRSPAGTEVLYGYTHVPRQVRGDAGDGSVAGRWDDADLAAMADRIEQMIEDHAPGFRSLIIARHVLGPVELEEHDPNLVGGAINGGTSSIHQQLFFRPVPGLGRSETAISGLYLASSSAHPGGGVHGACGANAARAALNARRPAGRLITAPALARLDRVLRFGPRSAP
jgi:phytoene dehydrogenase-like protein